jgi:hypothetical protein
MHRAPFYEIFIPTPFNYRFAGLAGYLKVKYGCRSMKYSVNSYAKYSKLRMSATHCQWANDRNGNFTDFALPAHNYSTLL